VRANDSALKKTGGRKNSLFTISKYLWRHHVLIFLNLLYCSTGGMKEWCYYCDEMDMQLVKVEGIDNNASILVPLWIQSIFQLQNLILSIPHKFWGYRLWLLSLSVNLA
jgi:hypothetical protein